MTEAKDAHAQLLRQQDAKIDTFLHDVRDASSQMATLHTSAKSRRRPLYAASPIERIFRIERASAALVNFDAGWQNAAEALAQLEGCCNTADRFERLKEILAWAEQTRVRFPGFNRKLAAFLDDIEALHIQQLTQRRMLTLQISTLLVQYLAEIEQTAEGVQRRLAEKVECEFATLEKKKANVIQEAKKIGVSPVFAASSSAVQSCKRSPGMRKRLLRRNESRRRVGEQRLQSAKRVTN